MDREGLAPCSHEEADSGMMAQIADAANTYTSNSILTGTLDSNTGTLGGLTPQNDVPCVDNCCTGVAPKAVTQTATA